MESYRDLSAKDKRQALFAACIEEGEYLTTGTIAEKYRDNNETVLIYRHPNLVALGLEVQVRHQSWQSSEDSITYNLASYFPYDYPKVRRATFTPKMNSAKTDGVVIEKAVKTILNGLVARRRAVSKKDHSSAAITLEDERIRSGYVLGISDQANEMLKIDTFQKLESDAVTSSMEIRAGLNIHIAKLHGKGYRLLITITADATQEDVLETTHTLIDNGYNIYKFGFEQPNGIRKSHVMISMMIDTEYRPEVFNLIEKTRLFQRQIVNEMEALSKK